jgi:hypothetical protein
MEFTVAVWGWFPENEHEFGGSPELDDVITVTADSEREAVNEACAQFDADHCFEHVEGEVRS